LIEAGVAYVDFARRRPAFFEAMFSSTRNHVGASSDASRVALIGLVGLIESCQADGSIPVGDSRLGRRGVRATRGSRLEQTTPPAESDGVSIYLEYETGFGLAPRFVIDRLISALL
jgi:hypothetical protein